MTTNHTPIASTIPWAPDAFGNRSDADMALIKVGFERALDEVYRAEKERHDELVAALRNCLSAINSQLQERAEPADVTMDLATAWAEGRAALAKVTP